MGSLITISQPAKRGGVCFIPVRSHCFYKKAMKPGFVEAEEKKQAGFQAGREENERTVYDYERFAGAVI